MDDCLEANLHLLQEHVSKSPHPTRCELICLNVDELMVYRPSLYTVGYCDKPQSALIDVLGIVCDNENIDLVDSEILAGLISYIFTFGEHEGMLHRYINGVISMVASKSRVISDVEISEEFEPILSTWVNSLRRRLMSIVKKHTVGYASVTNTHCYDELVKKDKYYILVNSNVYFNNHAYDISLYIKRYTKIETS